MNEDELRRERDRTLVEASVQRRSAICVSFSGTRVYVSSVAEFGRSIAPTRSSSTSPVGLLLLHKTIDRPSPL